MLEGGGTAVDSGTPAVPEQNYVILNKWIHLAAMSGATWPATGGVGTDNYSIIAREAIVLSY